MDEKLKTNIAAARWCLPSEGYAIQDAKIPSMAFDTGTSLFSWMDQLFEGGIVLPDTPDKSKQALTILLSGPPGTGKSILAMELCYRWTFSNYFGDSGAQSLYITSEDHEPWLINKAKSFNWKHAERFRSFDELGDNPGVAVVSVKEAKNFDNIVGSDFLLEFAKFFGLQSPKEEAKPNFKNHQIVVIDSLNSIDISNQKELFDKFVGLVASGPRILIIILDSSPAGQASAFWEFVSDIIIRLDRSSLSGYMIRTIEIIKARYQAHVWGTHQLKIYEPSQGKLPAESNHEYSTRLMRSFPFCTEGGIFIFPSIHYVLSVYKRKSPVGPLGYVRSPVLDLNTVLGRGFPKGRCTGLIGVRGGHKSHLGLVQVLSGVIGNTEKNKSTLIGRGIIVSLRDDEGTTRQSIESILRQHWPDSKLTLDTLINQDRLEIIYYSPGYITPEEFFHRLLLSIHRMKRSNPNEHITLLFNSLDQLSSRFPLCAQENIFVPGIIQMLSAEEVTSFFVAARESSQSEPDYHGLESLAELILSFEYESISRDNYCSIMEATFPGNKQFIDSEKEKLSEVINVVVINVDRFAGGQSAGANGILELVTEGDLLKKIYRNEGLYCLPRTIRNRF